MKLPPTKFELMRRNRRQALAHQLREEAREVGYDMSGDPDLEAVNEEIARRRELALRAAARPWRWWHAIPFPLRHGAR